MKPTGRRFLIALVALALGAVPAIALAQSPFTDYKDAAKAQYGTTTTTTPTTPTTAVTAPTDTTTTPAATVGSENQTPTETEQAPEETGNGTKGPGSNHGNNPNNGAANAGPGAANAGANGNPLAGLSCEPYAIIGLSPLLRPAVPDVVETLGRAAYVADVTEPLDADKLKALTDGTQWEGAATDLKKLRAFAKELGSQVPDATALAKKAFPELAKFPPYPLTITPQDFQAVSGIVLTHVQVPLKGDENTQRNTFVKWFIKGLQTVKVPAVGGGTTDLPLAGVEQKVTKKTEIPFFKKYDVSSVDDVDLQDGKVSLARIMLDGTEGHFGVKKSADDGKLAKPDDDAKDPLLCRPDRNYVAGKLLRSTAGGVPGGGSTVGILLLLGLVAIGSFLVLVERRTRRVRRARAQA